MEIEKNKSDNIFIAQINSSDCNSKINCIRKNNHDDYISLKLELLFNNKCIDVLDKNLKGEKVNLSFEVLNNAIYSLYDGEIITEPCKCDFALTNDILDDIKYDIKDSCINIFLKKNILSEVNSLEDIYHIAKKFNYEKEKIDYLIDNKIPNNLILKLLNSLNSSVRVNIKPDTLYLDENQKLKICLIKILNGGSVRLFGPKSSGKNTLADTLIWLLERKVYKFSSNPQADKTDLIGETSLVTIKDDKGDTYVVTEFQERILTKAMKEGAILLMDEINTNDIGLLSVLHGPLDDSKLLSTPNGEVKAKEGFCVIATMNEDYQGTSRLNPALVDRMLGVSFEMPNSLKNILLIKRPDTPQNIIEYLEMVYSKIKTLIIDEVTDDSPFSIRGFIDAIDLINYGIDREEAVNTAIINRIQEIEYRKAVKMSLQIC